MESFSWPESSPSNRINKAIKELKQGEKITNKLQEMLNQPGKIEPGLDSGDDTVVQVMGMFEKTLSVFSSSSSNFNGFIDYGTHGMSSTNSWDDQRLEDYTESVKTLIPTKLKRGCYKRRKGSLLKTQITPTLFDDGYAWRKYGQKGILNSKHQRHYYRCSYKIEQGCKATKQVQMTDDEPPKYSITYHQGHTCKNPQRLHEMIFDSPNPRDNSVLYNFEKNMIIPRNQVGPLPSSTKHKPKEAFPSSCMKLEKVSSSDYYTCDPVTQSSQVPSEPESMMPSLDIHEDMTYTTGLFPSTCGSHLFGIDDMLENNDLSDLLSCYLNYARTS